MGQLGNGTLTDSSMPVPASGIADAVDMSVGNYHTCVVLSGGSIKCWGNNVDAQLGTGDQTTYPSPMPVSLISNAVKVAGGYGHSCAILKNGTIQCWGYNNFGQLGRGDLEVFGMYPVDVSGISNGTAVSTGRFHTCASLNSGLVQCWGSNSDGQLGDGTMSDSNLPVTVIGITSAITVAVSDYHSCAILQGGSVRCWGENSYGGLGIGSTDPNSAVPVTVDGF